MHQVLLRKEKIMFPLFCSTKKVGLCPHPHIFEKFVLCFTSFLTLCTTKIPVVPIKYLMFDFINFKSQDKILHINLSFLKLQIFPCKCKFQFPKLPLDKHLSVFLIVQH